jgi:hypothetical protein
MFGGVVNVERKCIVEKVLVIIVNTQDVVLVKDWKCNEQEGFYSKQRE